MKGKRYTPRRPRRSRHRLQILLAILLGLVLLWGVDMRLRPLVEQVAGYQCRVAVLEVMNEAIEEELEKAQWGTKELVTTKYNPDGSIAALEMDAIALNRLKAELTQAISNELLAMGEQRVDIPLGTMLGWQFLTGRGPDIPLKLIPASFVQSSVTDVFETAGINQTQHRVMLSFQVEVSAILPGCSVSVLVQNDFCAAQTLIVGQVPQVYAVAQGENTTQPESSESAE